MAARRARDVYPPQDSAHQWESDFISRWLLYYAYRIRYSDAGASVNLSCVKQGGCASWTKCVQPVCPNGILISMLTFRTQAAHNMLRPEQNV